MQNRYNFAQDLRVSIRGFGARAQFGIRGIKVLVDGIPETLPDGQGSVDSIDLGATSQIEVIRGPSSSLYGNASGGVISLTSEGGGAEPYAQVRVAAGGYGFEKTQIKTGGETERLNYLVSLSDQEIDGYRAQSAYENKLLTGRFDLDLGKDRSLLTVVNFTDQPVSDDPGGLTAAVAPVNPRSAAPQNVQFDAGESLEQTRLGFVYTAPAGERGTITARNYYAWRDFGNLLADAEPRHRRPRAPVHRRRLQLQLRRLLARSPEPLHRGRRLRRSRRRSPPLQQPERRARRRSASTRTST